MNYVRKFFGLVFHLGNLVENKDSFLIMLMLSQGWQGFLHEDPIYVISSRGNNDCFVNIQHVLLPQRMTRITSRGSNIHGHLVRVILIKSLFLLSFLQIKKQKNLIHIVK